MSSNKTKNVLGNLLQLCSESPKTGFYRTGCCETGPEDSGRHLVCAIMTGEFLQFTKQQGNDLSTPMPAYNFPGLKTNDRWCLCALRWKEAFDAGVAPPVVLEATHEAVLRYVSIENLLAHAHLPVN
ncbi:MAG: DUF2237 domain-containing protein [Tunicatimonas sp.]|uniref:DUF2237 family protein n=1 Tax=Tunicatimonas sp. TaxID=1940096 RepID=UPI003C78FA7C